MKKKTKSTPKSKSLASLFIEILNRSILHPRSRRLLNEAALLEVIVIVLSVGAFLSFVLIQSILYVLLLVIMLLLVAYNGHLWHVVARENKSYARGLFLATVFVAVLAGGWLYGAIVRDNEVTDCYAQQSELEDFSDYNTVQKRTVATQKCVDDADKKLRTQVTFGFDRGSER